MDWNKKPKEPSRQNWATPEWFVDELERLAGWRFAWDLAAEAWSAKAPRWCGPGSPWVEDTFAADPAVFGPGPGWLNCPWGNILPWAELITGPLRPVLPVAFLVPPRTDERWWHHMIKSGAHLSYIQGRLAYEPPPGIDPSSPRGGSVLFWTGPTRIWPVSMRLV